MAPSFDENDDPYFESNIDDIFREIDTSEKINIRDSGTLARDSKGAGADLGIDEEVKITKKRKPIAKLDDNRYRNPLVFNA
jgi:replication fork protection complex subunit Csm3/Swi3